MAPEAENNLRLEIKPSRSRLVCCSNSWRLIYR